VPGFAAALKAAGHSVNALRARALGEGCTAHLDRIIEDGSGLRLITALPHEHGAEAATSRQQRPLATHLLDGHIARALNSFDTIKISRIDGDIWLLADPAVRLNGEPVTDNRRLRAGDTVSDGKHTLTLITVDV
jgi:hypothetical protein